MDLYIEGDSWCERVDIKVRLNTTPSHSWVSMSLLVGILTSIILMSLKYPCLWVFKDPSIDFDICHGYLCKYLWQVYGLELISMMCQNLKMKLITSATIRYTWIILFIDNCTISASSLLNPHKFPYICEYSLNNPWVYDTHECVLMRIWVVL